MILFKLGLYSCLCYVGITALLEGALMAAVHITGGFGTFWGEKHWFWTLGAKLGVIFGVIWFISFSIAWCIVCSGLKSTLERIGH